MRHQNGRARLGEASRAVLALSIPTPRQPQLLRETTADERKYASETSREPKERGVSRNTRCKPGLEQSCICTASSSSTKEVSYFYLVRDERDGRFEVVREVVARATAASLGDNGGNYVG
jgi:hypothetical protein